jgi:hypothetical protein
MRRREIVHWPPQLEDQHKLYRVRVCVCVRVFRYNIGQTVMVNVKLHLSTPLNCARANKYTMNA